MAKTGRPKKEMRRYQFALAQKNANMAIWLGKQYLGQSDTPEQKEDSGVQIIDDL